MSKIVAYATLSLFVHVRNFAKAKLEFQKSRALLGDGECLELVEVQQKIA